MKEGVQITGKNTSQNSQMDCFQQGKNQGEPLFCMKDRGDTFLTHYSKRASRAQYISQGKDFEASH